MLGCVGRVWGVCGACVGRVSSGECVVWCVGGECVCGGGRVWGRGRGGCMIRRGEKVSLAALLSGYLGKSGHLPR